MFPMLTLVKVIPESNNIISTRCEWQIGLLCMHQWLVVLFQLLTVSSQGFAAYIPWSAYWCVICMTSLLVMYTVYGGVHVGCIMPYTWLFRAGFLPTYVQYSELVHGMIHLSIDFDLWFVVNRTTQYMISTRKSMYKTYILRALRKCVFYNFI